MDLIEGLQLAFPFSLREVELLINTAPYRYKIHDIEKRNGRGKRMIAQPTAELKAVQRWIVLTYISRLPVHPAAMAYRPRLGIRNHAQAHATNNYLLKLDFQNFFPSIHGRDFRAHLDYFMPELTLPDRLRLTRLLFRDENSDRRSRSERATGNFVLSIGAPSSPAISNTLMYAFDLSLAEYCKALDVKYTRYADDLAFSTNQPWVLEKVKDYVVDTCGVMAYPKLRLNSEKTVFTSKKFQRRLTGLVLTNDGKASIGRERKREVRSMMHHFAAGRLSAEEVQRLRGLVAFILSVDKKYVGTLERMVGSVIYRKLMLSE